MICWLGLLLCVRFGGLIGFLAVVLRVVALFYGRLSGACCFELVFVYVGLCLVLGVGFWACDLTLVRWVVPDWFGLKCWGCVVYGVWGGF